MSNDQSPHFETIKSDSDFGEAALDFIRRVPASRVDSRG